MSTQMTAEQLEQFRQRLSQLGFNENNLGANPAGASSDKLIFSSDPAESHVTPHFITINDIAQLHSMAGVPDPNFANGQGDDSHVHYPVSPFPNGRRVASTVNPASLVPVSIPNPPVFPVQAAYFKGTSLTIDKPVVIKGSQPVFWTYDDVTMSEGGSLEIMTDCNLVVNTFNATGSDNVITVAPEPLSEAAAPDGSDGSPGISGTAGASCQVNNTFYFFSGYKKSCVQQPTNGTNGGPGTSGEGGAAGMPAADQPSFYFTVVSLNGNLTVQAGGGTGQNGGNGGNGGTGGAAGTAGASSPPCGTALNGLAGSGGNGGNGGAAGNGGNGNIVNIMCPGPGKVTTSSTGGQAGTPGTGGQPGKAGPMAPNGTSVNGAQGVSGAAGANGASGVAGTKAVFVLNGNVV